jgi:outer membrane murein-binding lipoprotein Lpp
MIKNRLGKSVLLLSLFILAGFFLCSCEKSEAPSGEADKLNQLSEKVEKLSTRVDELSQRVDELSTKIAAPVKGGNLVVCQPAEPPGLDPTANTAAAIDRVVYANIY